MRARVCVCVRACVWFDDTEAESLMPSSFHIHYGKSCTMLASHVIRFYKPHLCIDFNDAGFTVIITCNHQMCKNYPTTQRRHGCHICLYPHFSDSSRVCVCIVMKFIYTKNTRRNVARRSRVFYFLPMRSTHTHTHTNWCRLQNTKKLHNEFENFRGGIFVFFDGVAAISSFAQRHQSISRWKW